MLSVTYKPHMLNVIIHSVVMLSVVTPAYHQQGNELYSVSCIIFFIRCNKFCIIVS
jgi:hypothetical protein